MTNQKEDRILLAHGSGGGLSEHLINEIIRPYINNPDMGHDDAAVLSLNGQRLAFTADSYVVSPLFFAGGDIGRLAVCGTVNDLSTAGAIPQYLSLSFIIEEGLPITDFKAILQSIKDSAVEANVHIVTGDTKVVGKGAADGIFINTSGIGIVPQGINPTAQNIKAGDQIILSGTVGDHGITIMSLRNELGFGGTLKSDVAPLNHMVEAALKVCPYMSAMRDPTRGGLTAALNEFSQACGLKIIIDEQSVLVNDAVAGACSMLGFDPLYVANEGKMLFVCPPNRVDDVLQSVKSSKYGTQATVIGEITNEKGVSVSVRTHLRALRRLDVIYGELLPRIC
ncbi:MAG: hydrogenase expression/formation protein HypE [Chloroflexi bacterium]|nr:hydrogenase expression/formation protein HypE [Chloroflexota bacterium]